MDNAYIAIIPARSGSKRLPGKNLLEIAGKPLIAWTIEAAIDSAMFERIIVSTDSREIADAAIEAGAEAPFLRPAELSTDNTSTADVINHLLIQQELGNNNLYSHFVLLQPTSPLRSASNIDEAVELLEKKGADAVISVCRTEHSPLWSNTLPADMSMSNFINSEIQKTPSQDLPEYYRLNGALYICSIKRFIEEGSLFLKDNIYAYPMSRKDSIDIDDDVDFELAEIYLKRRH